MAPEPEDVQRLPAGSHGIPAEVVARNQRERLVAAAAEACADGGYAEASVADLARRAGVSTATFYKLFDGKRECVLEAHRELSARLLEEVDHACEGEGGWEARVRAGVRVVLDLLAADPPSARLLTIEVMAVGRQGTERNDAALEALAARLRKGRPESAAPTFPNVDWAMLAAASMLVGKRVMAGEAAGLPELEDELVAMLTALR